MHLKESNVDPEKLVDKIPDVYFDWYARLLPGAIAVALYFYVGTATPEISATWLFIYVAVAYVAGHVIQPLSSLCVGGIQKLLRSNEAAYEKAKKNTALAGPVAKVSKAHAESVGMLSTCYLVVVVAFQLSNWGLIVWLLIVYFLLASFERAWARKRKIAALEA